jgi:hypothetical protein
MSITCPQCGGTALREIAPGFFECVSDIDISMPPGMMGNPTLVGGARRCGHRFQTGRAGGAMACAFCGRDSIGTCEGECGRRLCGIHGAADGPFRCAECIDKERREGEDARQANFARIRTRLRAAIESDDAATLAAALREDGPQAAHFGLLEDNEFREAWKRYIRLCSPTPDYEYVPLRPGGRWRDPTPKPGRLPIWEWETATPGPTNGGTEPLYYRYSYTAIDREGLGYDWGAGRAPASARGCAVRPGQDFTVGRKGSSPRLIEARPAPDGFEAGSGTPISRHLLMDLVERLERASQGPR